MTRAPVRGGAAGEVGNDTETLGAGPGGAGCAGTGVDNAPARATSGPVSEAGLGAASSSVIETGPSELAARLAWRPCTERRNNPSSTRLPTENAFAGLPSMAIRAAPVCDAVRATTPANCSRLGAFAATSVTAPTLPKSRATAPPSTTVALGATVATGSAKLALPSQRRPQNTALAAASAHTTKVSVRGNQALCGAVIMV